MKQLTQKQIKELTSHRDRTISNDAHTLLRLRELAKLLETKLIVETKLDNLKENN